MTLAGYCAFLLTWSGCSGLVHLVVRDQRGPLVRLIVVSVSTGQPANPLQRVRLGSPNQNMMCKAGATEESEAG
jgi:hypothetical protein